MRIRKLFLGICAALGVAAPAAKASDVALVDDGLGQALLFVNNGLCYAALPSHVVPLRDRIALSVPNPPQSGAAEIFWRDPSVDLALAYVEGDLANRCQIELRAMQSDISTILQTNETGRVKAVHFGGQFFDRMGVDLIEVWGDSFRTKMNDRAVDGDLEQGFSGSLVTVGGVLAGIAINNDPDTLEATFLRMDKVAALARANLQGNHPSNRAIAPVENGSGFRVTAFEGGGQSGATALEPGSLSSPWIAEWPGRPISFEVTLSTNSLVPLNRVVLVTKPDAQTTPPRGIVIELDRGMPGAPYWTTLAAPDMSPTGAFDLRTGGTVARRVRISLMDVWHPDRPLRLDTLWVE
ncbi:MAG: hypothetical protein MK180_13515 [Rhodobacteraceae bacterium]|nr:hypothetical protein [Paracoccaceae bacterium]